jgi:hypothetical protein
VWWEAVLATPRCSRLGPDGNAYPSAVSGALLDACGFPALALLVAAVDMARHPSHGGAATPSEETARVARAGDHVLSASHRVFQ